MDIRFGKVYKIVGPKKNLVGSWGGQHWDSKIGQQYRAAAEQLAQQKRAEGFNAEVSHLIPFNPTVMYVDSIDYHRERGNFTYAVYTSEPNDNGVEGDSFQVLQEYRQAVRDMNTAVNAQPTKWEKKLAERQHQDKVKDTHEELSFHARGAEEKKYDELLDIKG
jgi:hypothetical protein